MRFLLCILLLTLSLEASREESFDYSLSAWATLSEDFQNDYHSLQDFNKAAIFSGSFVTRRLAVNIEAVHNEKYEDKNYMPHAVATLKLFNKGNFSLSLEGGRSNEHSVINMGTNTPKSIGASYAPLSYNDMGWENEMAVKFGEVQFSYGNWKLGILKGEADFDSDFTDAGDLDGFRLLYSKGKWNVMYGFYSQEQTFFGFNISPFPAGTPAALIALSPYPFLITPTARQVDSKYHALTADGYIGKHRFSTELMYVDTMNIYAFDIRWIYPIAEKWSGLAAYHHNAIDFDLGKAYNEEIKKGIVFQATNHLSIIADASYIKGMAPFLTTGQAVLPGASAQLKRDWGIANLTFQWDF